MSGVRVGLSTQGFDVSSDPAVVLVMGGRLRLG